MAQRIWIITLFPQYFKPFLEIGVIAKALSGERGPKLQVELVSLADYSDKSFKGVDDAPFGGGPGMVMRADVLARALKEGVMLKGGYQKSISESLHIIFPTPAGRRWDQLYCQEFCARVSSEKDLVFVCGRYEGVDQRFIEKYIDEEISVGDFVLTGGELATMTILDSSLRLIPGVLGNRQSTCCESFQDKLLDHPHFTRPRVFEEIEVPSVLLSGDHQKIDRFYQSERERVTVMRRSDMCNKGKHE